MGNAKYIGRVGALAVTLGIGAAVTTGLGLGIGVAWADETAPSTDSSPTAPSATDPSPGTPPSASPTGPNSSPGTPRGHILHPVAAGPNRAPRPAESSAGSPSGTEASGSPTAGDNAATTPGDSDPQPTAPAQDAPAQDSVAQDIPAAARPDGSGRGSTVVAQVQAADTATTPATADSPISKLRSATQVLRQPSADTLGTAAQTAPAKMTKTPPTAVSADSATAAPIAAATEATMPVDDAGVVSRLLSVAGSTSLAPGPTGESPAMLAMLAVAARRQPPAKNQPPALDPMQTSQDAGGTVHGIFNGTDPNNDTLTYRVTDAPDHGTVTIAGDTWTYTPTAWDGTSQIDDTFTVTVSDVGAAGFRLKGKAVLNHTDTEDVAVTVEQQGLPAPDVVTPPTERDDGSGIFDTELQYNPETVADVSAAPGFEPKYWILKSETYDPVTGKYTAELVPTQAGQLRAALGLDTSDALTLQVTPQPTGQTFALRSASFAPLAADPPDQALQLPAPPAANFVVTDPAIPVGSKPAGVVVTGKYAYILNSQLGAPNGTQDSTVTVIGADPDDAATYNQLVTTIPVGNAPIFAGLSGNRLYVVNSSLQSGSPSTVTIINTDDNSIVDADPNDGENDIDSISMPRGAFNPLVSPDGNSIYLLNQSDGNVYVIDTNPANAATYNTVVATIPVATGPTYDPVTGTSTFNFAISGGFNTGGSRLYVVRDTQTLTQRVGGGFDSTFKGELIVIDTASNSVVGDPLDLGQYGGYSASDGSYLYVPTLDTDNLDVTNPNSPPPPGYVTVVDIRGGSPALVDLDPNTPEFDRMKVGDLPLNISFSQDGSLAYIVNSGNGTISVIDTAAKEVLDLDPATPGVQGIVFDTTPTASLQSVNVIGISPDGNRLYVSNYSDNTVTALSFVTVP
jgi:DNA-binding beta-propeller fold protein YncE